MRKEAYVGGRGSGGRPKPRELKELSGTLRPDRDKGEPLKVRGGVIRCPAGTAPEVAVVFRRLVRELQASNFLRPIDTTLLLNLAQAIVLNNGAAAQLLAGESVVADPAHSGRLAPNPAYRIWKETGATIRALSGHFGLSPLDRDRLNVPEPDKSDEFEVFRQRLGRLTDE